VIAVTIDPSTPMPPWVLREFLLREEFERELHLDPIRFHPFLRPCRNRVLLVTDGTLDFSEAPFGLSMFVRTLLDTPGRYVRHEITLAHIDAAASTRMLPAETRIAARVTNFRFDNTSHFNPAEFDVVMLFGFSTSYGNRGPGGGLADTEVDALITFMNSGGGLFATGDHGSLGRALCHRVPRVRNMRYWESTATQLEDDAVSMGGHWRNDTNRGHPFDSQSDDTPQVIEPTPYTAGWIFQVQYPHPLLCGPEGKITVMPDHPHEGECVLPSDHQQTLADGSPEYPPASGAGAQPIPELISTNRVPAGNLGSLPSGNKLPTHAHKFGGIAAYDGHRADVGRVATDATWHHFVNVNLRGATSLPTPYDKGFLTPAGAPHLAAIRAYHRNLAVWLSRPDRIRCMNFALLWDVVFDDRVLEAVLSATDTDIRRIPWPVFKLIGVHARDSLGRTASRCQSIRLIVDLVLERALPDLIPDFDPWLPHDERRVLEWLDASPLLDIGLGGALVTLRNEVGDPTEESARKVDVDNLTEQMAEGGAAAVRLAVRALTDELQYLGDQLRPHGAEGS
jgi:hypothetical protein